MKNGLSERQEEFGDYILAPPSFPKSKELHDCLTRRIGAGQQENSRQDM
jgi:hypothetical protein